MHDDFDYDIWDTHAALVVKLYFQVGGPIGRWLGKQPPRLLDTLTGDLAACVRHLDGDPDERYMRMCQRRIEMTDKNYSHALDNMAATLSFVTSTDASRVQQKCNSMLRSMQVANTSIHKLLKG